jgi:hypothetical protein
LPRFVEQTISLAQCVFDMIELLVLPITGA